MSSRRDFILAAMACGLDATALAQGATSGALKQRPNILLLFPDQWRFDWTSSNKDLAIRTPHIDSLARRGTKFNRCMVASPVCAPSRACLASGMEYERCGVPNNDVNYPTNGTTIYRALRDADYHAMGCGKFDLAKGSNWWGIDGKWRLRDWGFTGGINNAGKWDQLMGIRLNGGKPADPYTTFLEKRGLLEAHVRDYRERQKSGYAAIFPTSLPDDAYCDTWITENAINLLKDAPDKSWFLQVNWAGPHNPEDITSSMEISVRSSRMPDVVGQNQYPADFNAKIRQNYTAMCENIDHGIGQILEHLKHTGQLERTLIIFSSDHGEMLGDLGRWGKSVPFQPSIGVPLVIAGPGVVSDAKNESLVSSIDLSATVLDYAGVAAQKMDGRSLRPILTAQAQKHRKVFYSGLGGWRLAFDGRYKVVTGFSLDPKERNGENMQKYDPVVAKRTPLVFDLWNDPGEKNNIASDMPVAARGLLNALLAADYPGGVHEQGL